MKSRVRCRIWIEAALFPQVEIGEQFLYEHEHLIMGLSYALAKSAKADRAITDADLIAALASMTKKQETLVNSGLHYETPIASLSQQAVVGEVQKMLKEYREAEQKHLGFSRLHDSDVLPRVGLPPAHGARSHFRKAKVAGLRGFRPLAIPRETIGRGRSGRSW